MDLYRYTVIIEHEDDGGYHAFCPTLKGCHTQGNSLEETLTNIQEAIEAYLESMKARNETIPKEDILIKPVEVAI